MADGTTAAPGAGAADRPRRARNPRYHVFEARTLQEPAEQRAEKLPEIDEEGPREARIEWVPGADVAAWVAIGHDIAAASDRDAIDKALDDLGREGEERLGVFWAPLAGVFKPRTKARQVQEVEIWS